MITAPVPVLLLGGWRATAFAAGLVIATAGWGIQSWRLDSAHKERDAARQTADVSVALNATNVETIRKLKDANAIWAAANAADKAAGREAVAAVERERDALQAELEKRRAQREKLYAHDTNAAAWGRAVVPNSVVRSLRD